MKCFYCEEEFKINNEFGHITHSKPDHRFQDCDTILYFDLIENDKLSLILVKYKNKEYWQIYNIDRQFSPEKLNKQFIDKLKNIYTLLN